MYLRKAGKLKGFSRSRITTFEYEEREYDRYRFACEIAIQHFEQDDLTLDSVLCDPNLASKFDEFVLTMIPDKPSSLKIRWFALRIRKSATPDFRKSAAQTERIPMPKPRQNPFELTLSELPAQPGLYWLSGNKKNLYVGETDNLRERVKTQFGHRKFDFWKVPPDHLEISIRAIDAPATTLLQRYQSRWISEWQPIGNYSKLAAAE